LNNEDRLKHGDVEQVLHENLLEADEFPEHCDTVIHLAALNEKDCVKLPSEAIRVNIDETRIILENAISKKVRHFIFFSTAHIYGSPLKGDISETTMPVPIHPYAITHKAAEDYVIAANNAKTIAGTVIRLSNALGAPVLPTVNRWTLLVNDLCRQAIEKKKLTLLSNGCQYRDFICLTDVEAAMHKILAESHAPTGIFNLGAGIAVPVIEMAKQIVMIYEEMYGEKMDIELPGESGPSDEPQLHYSVEKLKASGITIGNNIKKEIKDMLQFCTQHFKYTG